MLKRVCFFAFIFLHTALYMWNIEARKHIQDVSLLMQLHNETVNGTMAEPYLYRVLVPYVLSPLIDGTPRSYVIAYLLGDTLASMAMLWLLFKWCLVFVSETYAMLGVLLVAFTMPLMMNWWFYSVSTPLEVCLWLLGLFCLRHIWDSRSSSSLPP